MAYRHIRLKFHKTLLIMASVFVASGLVFNFQSIYSAPLGQAGNSVYDKECGTNIPDNDAAKEFLTIWNNMWGPDAEEATPVLKEMYDCVNEIYEQETGNNIKTQLDDQYDCKDPIDCLSEAMLRDQRDGGIDDDGDGEGSDDRDDTNPNIQ